MRVARVLIAVGVFVAAATAPSAASALGRPCATSAVHIAIVVDHGAGTSVSSLCVPAKSRDNGAVLLATRASMLGVPAPRYNASGLLCAIDGQPASGCGSEHDGKYSYWSYWHGTGGAWSYASIGPASSRVDADVVEGWRWEPNGSATPNDPPPRARADASTICTSTPATTSAPVTVPTVRANVATTLGVAATSVSRTPTPTNGVVPHATTAAPAKVDATTPAIARATSTSQPSALAGGVPISHAKPDDGSGAPIGLIVGVALVAALAGAGLFIARRRAPTT